MNKIELTKRESYNSPIYVVEEFNAIGTCENQQDYTGCYMEKNTAVLVLCDGIGGLERGELAAHKAVDVVLNLAKKHEWKNNPVQFLELCLKEANEAVFSLCDENDIPLQSGCTIVIVLIVGNKLYVANIGDSRAYLAKRNKLMQLTEDHNYGKRIERMNESGSLTEEEYAEVEEKGAALTSYIGIGNLEEYHISKEPIALERDEVLLMETDGLYKLVDDSTIYSTIREKVRCLDEVGEELLQIAHRNVEAYQDNTSIILFRIK